MDAASEGHLGTLQALLLAGADPSASNEVRSRVDVTYTSVYGMQAVYRPHIYGVGVDV
jgi:hypothetical protein